MELKWYNFFGACGRIDLGGVGNENKKTYQGNQKNAVLENRIERLEDEVSCLRSAVSNLQNLARILERDICNCRDIAAIGDMAKDSVLKAKE